MGVGLREARGGPDDEELTMGDEESSRQRAIETWPEQAAALFRRSGARWPMKPWRDMTRAEREEVVIAAREAGQQAAEIAARYDTTRSTILSLWERLIRAGKIKPLDRDDRAARSRAGQQAMRGRSGNPEWDCLTTAQRYDKALEVAATGVSRAEGARLLGITVVAYATTLDRARHARPAPPPGERDWSAIDPIIRAEWECAPSRQQLARKLGIWDSVLTHRAVVVLGLPSWKETRKAIAAAAPVAAAPDLREPHYAGTLSRELKIRAVRRGTVSLPYIPTLHGSITHAV